ncbi:MAG: MATE family efflux transporter [Eubacteriales bacterium]|nr:MATE family efflux transporter [Eubacteriales bacterium]
MQNNENILGTTPINALLIKMSLPIMISMLMQACYNIVDSIFISRLSENALSAISLSYPLQFTMIAVGIGTGVGISANLSKNLGEKRMNSVNDYANHSIFLSIICSIVFIFIGIFFVKPFFTFQTENIEIINYGVSYCQICLIGSLGLFIQVIGERLLQSTGLSIFSMYTQLIGAIINIILDPIFIFGLFGMPKMGTAGAALATIIGQFCAAIIALYFNFTKNTTLQFSFKNFKPQRSIIMHTYMIGLPSIVMQSIGSIMIFGMNKILLNFSTTATAVLGVYYKVQSFIFMPVFGLNSGLIPIVSFNFGARNKKRIIDGLKFGMLYASIIMIIGTILFNMFPKQILNIFNASNYMIEIGVPALRIISLHYIFAGINIILIGAFQSLGKATNSLIISIVRQLVFLLPIAYILSKLFGLNAIWFSFLISECLALIITILFFIDTNKKIIIPLQTTKNEK